MKLKPVFMPLYVFDKVEIAESVALPDALATVCAMFSRDVVSYLSLIHI